ncbi:MAG: hypothetical protein G01um101416_313 [Microgenomates group bacterium Gr01-1014_16]|nr:MAG: hypothetical protein G01um101416_313 [Microgenomates group bacterium Gr01-1014_16]
METKFAYKKEPSQILGQVKRPIALVSINSQDLNKWFIYTMIVDTGADFSLLPFHSILNLGLDIERDCREAYLSGAGGKLKIHFLKKPILARIGHWQGKITLGFAENDDLPPILGRHKALDHFHLHFHKFKTIFE